MTGLPKGMREHGPLSPLTTPCCLCMNLHLVKFLFQERDLVEGVDLPASM